MDSKLDKLAISERFRQFITEHYITVKNAAEALGISSATLSSSYLNGKSVPGGELIAKLIQAGCDVDWLLTGKTRGQEANTRVKHSYNSQAVVSGKDSIVAEKASPYLDPLIQRLEEQAETIGRLKTEIELLKLKIKEMQENKNRGE